ncbi:uncharacterized protein LOC136089935 [Hydra vulgaris]|uniref:Uncharacterized protein LOC136089935 n=1 Tax=Hydra vulgaris TaxID=6087 RepID=A0ABM4DCG9_HYDVU
MNCDLKRLNLKRKMSDNTYFDGTNINNIQYRRKKRRLNMPYIRDISLPCEPTNKKIKQQLKKKIDDGTYNSGEKIVPQRYEKIFISSENQTITKKEVHIEGRKISLKDIRLNMFKDHEIFMKVRNDNELEALSQRQIVDALDNIKEYKDEYDTLTKKELINILKTYERTRNLMFWHDCSSISNHTHFLVTVSVMYDTAIFLSSFEYKQKYGEDINVQSEVEKPYLYILGRCPSNDQQLLYSDDRINDILQLSNPLEFKGTPILDVARIFKGDNPAAQLEAGHQKGGNYFCWACNMHADLSNNISISLSFPYTSLQNRIDHINASNTSQLAVNQGKTKLYSFLKKDQIEQELYERNIQFPLNTSVKKLKELLANEMHGVQGLPALLFKKPGSSLTQLNLLHYEILNNEPMHDISNHIKNIFDELPYLVEKKDKKIVENIIKSSFNGIEAKNAANYRKSLLIVTNWFLEHYKVDHFVFKFLLTLCEIQNILYMPEESRSTHSILRLINTTFVHAIIIKEHLEANLKNSKRKFFGAYYHSITSHAPLQYRLFAGRTSNVEKEEAMFQNLKLSTKTSSNHHSDNVIFNAIIRNQAKKYLNEGKKLCDGVSILHKFYQPLHSLFNDTKISFTWIEKNSNEYQKLLEKSADYLVEDINVWWKEVEDGVVFFDINYPNNSKKIFTHFRSSSMQQQSEYLEKCWKHCLENKHKIPAYKITVNANVFYLDTLQYFQIFNTENISRNSIIPLDIILI